MKHEMDYTGLRRMHAVQQSQSGEGQTWVPAGCSVCSGAVCSKKMREGLSDKLTLEQRL